MTTEFLFMNLICPIQTKPISKQSIVSLTIKSFHIDFSQSKNMRISFLMINVAAVVIMYIVQENKI